MTTLQLVRVHELDAVREIIEQAEAIVNELEIPEPFAVRAFEKAVDLLAARIPIQPMPPMFSPPDLRGLRG